MIGQMSLATIEDVISALDKIVERAWNERSRAGYFAALYRRVTRGIRTALAQNRFQDGTLLERLDLIFAARYLDALSAFQNGGAPSRSWRIAFQGYADAGSLIVQQLLAGMNAHINLDLGIASAQTSPGRQLPQLKPDFDLINVILAEQVSGVLARLAAVSPLIGELGNIASNTETRLINFDLVKARNTAWLTAERLAVEPAFLTPVTIDGLDLTVSVLGKAVLYPPLLRDALFPIRNAESNDIRHVIEVLAHSDGA
jgi:hypothetical protein